MYQKIQLFLSSGIIFGVWYNVLYQSHKFNLNKKEEIELMDLYKDIVS